MKGAKLRLEKDGVKTASSAKEHSARITALTTENLSLKGQISSMRQSNTSSNTSMNTSLDKLTIKLKESEASLKTAWQDLNRVMDMNTILSQDLNKAKNQIKELSARIAATDKANNEAYKVLNIYNQDNDGIFSGPPIGDVTMGKLKKLLCV
jgi:chromosome segregation ATPase